MTVPNFILASCLLIALAPSQPDEVVLEFRVRVPRETNAKAKVYLAGNLEALGRWKADGVLLEREEGGHYHAKLKLPRGKTLEYKLTLGSCRAVEKNASGGDIPNRKLEIEKDATVQIEVARWARTERLKSTLSGQFRYHRDFRSKFLGNERTLIVYLPPRYAADRDRRYPVLYLHDGQNVFDAATSFLGVEWQADETAERLIRKGRIRPLILVGIYNNGERMNEYTMDRDRRFQAGGKGKLYARFVAEEVKPFIDKEYRTLPGREHTAVAGSSLGGLISLYIAREHKDKFSMCAALSPALGWNQEQILKDFEQDAGRIKGIRFWLDMGSKENTQPRECDLNIAQTRKLVKLFDEAGLNPGKDYYYWEVHSGQHHEADWAARFDKVLLFLFGK